MTDDYRSIADALAAAIQGGRLRPGERLPPQRAFAYERGIAASTAGRVYSELRRRGLVSGEVGRGTFVRDGAGPADATLIDRPLTRVNLEVVFSVLDGHQPLLSNSLARLANGAGFAEALQPVGTTSPPGTREVAAAFLSRPNWSPGPAQVLFTGNGKQAIAAALAALGEPGSRVGVEQMTYPVVKAVAARLGIEVVPIPLDSQGLSADGLDSVLTRARLAGIYIQTSAQSPTGVTLSVERRMAIARVLQRHDVVAIEDGIYHFLIDEPPLAAFAPEHVVFVDSLSKRLAAGFGLGVLAAPVRLVDKVAAAIRRGVWMPSGLALSLGIQWMGAPELAQIVADKRDDARHRQRVARETLRAFAIGGDDRAYHLWLPLPEHWRSEAFAAAALRQGIAVTPGAAFAVHAGHAPNGVRLALAAPAANQLRGALERIGALALAADEPFIE